MSDQTPDPKTSTAPETDPAAADLAPETKAETKADKAQAKAEAKADAATAETASGTATGEVTPAEAPAASGVAGQQVVYVEAPIPPRVRSNRIVGVLLALLGAVVFAVAYAGAAAVLITFGYSGQGFSPVFSAFVQSAFFWIPIMMFALAFIVLTVILNRAGWWAHVLGSLFVAVFVYFTSIGLLLLVDNVVGKTSAEASAAFSALAINPLVIAATLVAREVSIWIGLAIAARGRRVKVRNEETRTAWDREQDEKKAEYERTGTAPAE